MTESLIAPLNDLADTLTDLRRRFQQAAQVEVARAIGEAVREVALVLVGGPRYYQQLRPESFAASEDPWGEPADRPLPLDDCDSAEAPACGRGRRGLGASRLEPAIVVGLTAVRWSLMRSGQLIPAVAIGLIVASCAYLAAPAVAAALAAWSAADDLLYRPSATNRE
jgi:hypothetical protein